MRHARIERWSRGNSAIHRRHAAAKILAALVLLISIATLHQHTNAACGLYLVLLIGLAAGAGLAPLPLLGSAAGVLPFALCFAVVSALAGDPANAVWLVIRAYLSALTALLLIATTPLPDLIDGLEWLRAPRFLLQVMQFLYRYLIVLMEEANAMRQAGSARAGSLGTLRFRQAAGAAGVLFVRAYGRAQKIHQAMLARGFEGKMPVFKRQLFRIGDAGFVATAAILVVGLRLIS